MNTFQANSETKPLFMPTKTLSPPGLFRQTIIGLLPVLLALSQTLLLQSLHAATSPSLRIEPQSPAPKGRTPWFKLHLQGGSNTTVFLIQSSTNLLNWRPVLSGKSKPGQDLIVMEVMPTNKAQFFLLREIGGQTDTNPPAWTNGVNGRLTPISPGLIRVSWDPATDDVGVAQYNLYLNGLLLTNVLGNVLSCLLPLDLRQSADLRIQALDASDNSSDILPLAYLPGDKILAASDDNGRVFVFYVTTNGAFNAGTQIATVNSVARGLAIGDFDGDGILDLITGGASGGTLTPFFFHGNGDGTFAAPVALPTAPGANGCMMGATVGDFDADGNLDFVCNGDERYVFFYWGHGDGTFTLEVKDWGCCGRGLAAGDFDEDGREDLARATYSDGQVRLFLSNGDRTFTEINPAGAFGSDPYGLVAGDFDEDGHLDLIANTGPGGDVVFYQGLGNGAFTSLTTNGPLANLVLGNYAAFATADYNSDGHLDMALAGYSSGTVYFFPGNGDGTFSTNRVTLSTALGNTLGIAAPLRRPRVDVNIAPAKPVVGVNVPLNLTAVGSGVSSNDFFRWTFGDETTNKLAWSFTTNTPNLGQSVAHTYTNEGRFLARLWHTTTNALNSVRGAWVTVQGAPPVANPGGPYVLNESAAYHGLWSANLDGSASSDDFGIVSYIWNFGDGTAATNNAPSVTHVWANIGPWTVSLTVVDAAGQTDTKSTTVTFTPGLPPVAVITGPAVVDETAAQCGVWTASFSGNSSTDDFGIWKYAWDFGNGRQATGPAVQTTYTAVGTYTVTLTVTDQANQTNATTLAVTVKANALPLPVITGPHLLTVAVATNGLWFGAWNGLASTDDTGICQYNWNFGDGTSATGTQVTHQYGAQGVYPLQLQVTDNGNQSVTATQNVIVVAGNPPVARITASTLNPEGAQPITLSAASSTSDNGVYSYFWLLPPRLFTFAGNYLDPLQWRFANASQDDKVIITGPNSWGGSYFFSIATQLQRGGSIQGRVDTPTGDSHAMVGLKDLNFTSGRYDQLVYAIYFADGDLRIYEYGNDRGLATNYDRGTSYDFRIETKPGAGARYYLRPAGTGQDFALIFETGNYTDSFFSFGADVYSGTVGFADFLVTGVCSQARDLTASISPGGTVTLQVVDAALLTNVTTVVVAAITGAPPVAVINGPVTGQPGLELTYDGYGSSDDHAIASYTWNFGDGAPLAFGVAVSHHYSLAGTYTNTLTVMDYADQASSASLVVVVSGASALLTVPWQIINGVEQPHQVYAGKTTTLKAVARGLDAPFNFIWDYGDGSGSITNTITSSAAIYYLETPHAYSGSEGTPFYATIRLVQTNGTILSGTYPLLLSAKSIDVEMKMAIDEGLWHLYKTQTRYDIDANHQGAYWCDSGYCISAPASAVQAFAINGHLMTGDATRDPYVQTVQQGVHYLLMTLTYYNIGPQSFGDPDGNHNGIALFASSGRPIYETGPLMDAFVAAARPELVAPVGGLNVQGRLFRDIMQDLVDIFCWGQCDSPGIGGWRYGWKDWPDNSASQWGAIGLMAAERYWGLPAPAWAKARNLSWVATTEGAGFGYTGAGCNDSCAASTPSGLVQLAWDGIPTTNSLWLHGENFIAYNWDWLMGLNNLYANYATAKALRSANPPVQNLSATGLDWFRDPQRGLARFTIDRQHGDGSWADSRWVGDALSTAWSTIILSSSLFQQGPVAVITVAPNPSAVGYPVVFDARASYSQNPAYKVVEYRWDFDASNGVDFDHPDAVGPVVTNIFGALGTNIVTLQVRDNGSPQLSDTASFEVHTTMPPYPPTADAGGPYAACVGQDVHLDGSGSFCVDAAAGNFIQSWNWETTFQMPLQFKDASGQHAVLTNGFATSGQHRLGLRVKNANSTVYTNLALPDMTNDAFSAVYVYDRVIPDLHGRPKANKCQLTWTKAGDYAVVMRSQLGPDRGFAQIGQTDSAYATFLDTNVQYDVEYYYRVYAYLNGHPDPIGVSDAEYVVSFPRNFDERPPQFQSTPLRLAQVGQLYQVTLVATNSANAPMYFALLAGPTNLSLNPTSGVVSYVPTPAQLGSQLLSFAVTNNFGRDVLSYTLFVFPATNHPPVAVANGPYSGLAGQPIQFSSAGTLDPDNNTLRYFWNFGDGVMSTNPNPVHVYGGVGDYLVSLFVNDGYGGTASARAHAQIIRPDIPPVAIVSNGPNFTVRLGEMLALDGSGSYSPLGNPLTYTWLWGDGAVSSQAPSVLSHLYPAGGPYLGSLVVADNRGGSNTNNFQVAVGPPNRPPTITMTVSTNSPYVESTVTFDATATTDPDGDPMMFVWDFGDRSTTTGPLVTHAFHQISDFTVTLTVTDNHGGVSTASQLIHALNAPPVFTSIPPLLTPAGTNYTYGPTITDADGDTSTFQLVTGPVTMACDTNTGTLSWLPGTNNLGPNPIVLRATDARGASTDQSFTLIVSTPLGPQLDLQPTHIDMTNVLVDSQTLALSGTVRVYLTNNGPDPVPVPFTVSVFVDVDFDGAFSTNIDYPVGYGVFPAGFPANGAAYVDMTVNGTNLFKDCPLYAFVDSQGVVPEYNKLNNIMRAGSDAETNTPPVIDLSASFLQVGRLSLPTNALLMARLGNSGLVAVPANVPLAFYDGDPHAGGALIGVARSTAPLSPGMYQDLSATWLAPRITSHTVFVVADDPGTGTNLFPEITLANNTFSVLVDLSAILPPIADPGPGQDVNVGDTVVLNGRASSDPQGRPLTYQWSMLSLPIGSQAHLTGATSVSPSFLADVAGLYSAQLVVNNSLAPSTNPATVSIAANDTNVFHPPKITSVPSFQGMVSVLYTYQVTATDPQSKPLTFRLPQAPAGMTINTNTGLVQWTPANAGSFFVQVAADGVGGSFYQGYTLTILPFANLPPQFTSTPVTTTAPNSPYNYTALAISPVGNSITYSLTQYPAGMSINPQSGALAWTPTSSQLGGNAVAIVADDGHGGVATQTFNLVVLTSRANGPVVQPIPDQTVTAPASFATVPLDSFVSDPNYSASQISWNVSGLNLLSVTIDSNRVATISYPPGLNLAEQITFLATDPAGYSGYSAPTFTVIGNAVPPVAAIANLSPTDTTTIQTGSFNLLGTADDPGVPGLVAYRIGLYDANGALVNDVTPAPIDAAGWHEGRVPAGGSLGNLDFSHVRNGAYTLMLEVQANGAAANATAQIALSSQLKLGQLKFSQQDLVVPVAGAGICVSRTYDSLNLNSGDFGYSWTYSVADLGVSIDEQRTESEDLMDGTPFSLRTGGGWDVTLDMPDTGRRVTFTFSLAGGNLFRSSGVWTAPPGVNASLVSTCSSTLIDLGNGLPPYWQAAGIDTDWQAFDFPGFVLTTANGAAYLISRQDEGEHYYSGDTAYGSYVHAYSTLYLSRITLPSGDHTDFLRNGLATQNIVQYNASNQPLKSILFQRDSQNRIIAIYKPENLDTNGLPVGPASMTYSYDSAGNLAAASKLIDSSNPASLVYSAMTYTYGNARFPHYLTQIQSSSGLLPSRTEYDDQGRLIATIDGLGHHTTLQYNDAAHSVLTTDRLGNSTLRVYDSNGNVVAVTDPLGNTTQYTYDSDGNQTSITDPLGRVTSSAFDSSDHQLSMTDPLGNVVQYAYDGTGNLTTSTDPLGHSLSASFDSAGNLLSSRDALGNQTDVVYDSQGNITGTRDPTGNVPVTLNYDQSGNLVGYGSASGANQTFTLDAHGNPTAKTRVWVNPANTNDVEQVVSLLQFNDAGRLVQQVDPGGNARTSVFNANGQLSARLGPAGESEFLTYDALGDLIEMRFADGTVIRMVYDAEQHEIVRTFRHVPGTPTTATYALYDAAGRLLSNQRLAGVVVTIVSQPDGTSAPAITSGGTVVGATALQFDAAGQLAAFTDAAGQTARYEYDADGRQTAEVDPLGNRTEYGYDAAGRRTLVRDPLRRETYFIYDAIGRLNRSIFADGTSLVQNYSSAGQLASQVDPLGRQTSFEWNPQGQPAAVVLPAVANPVAGGSMVAPRYTFAYDANGNRSAITDPNGNVTLMQSDARNRIVARSLPLGQTESYAYDSLNRIQRLTNALGQVSQFLYDGAGRLTNRNDYAAGLTNPSAQVFFSYDALGRLSQLTDARGTTSYAYNDDGNVTAMTSPEGPVYYEYDPATGRQTRVSSDFTDVHYTYDAVGRVQSVQMVKRQGQPLPSPEVTSYSYTPSGVLSQVVRPNGVVTRYQYDQLDRLTALIHTNAVGLLLAAYTYSLAPDGRRTNVTSIVRTPLGQYSTNTTSYLFDQLSRLVEESLATPAQTLYTADYSYGLTGNRLQRRVTSGSYTLDTYYSYDSNDRLLTESNYVVSSGSPLFTNAIWGYQDTWVQYQYDAKGQLIQKNVAGTAPSTQQFAYDVRGRLASAVITQIEGGQTEVSTAGYAYDESGNCVRRHVVTTLNGVQSSDRTQWFLPNAQNPTGFTQVLEERPGGGGAPDVTYAIGLSVLGQTAPGDASHMNYLVPDGLGSTRQLVDASGSVTEGYSFDAWGLNLSGPGQATSTVCLFAGERYDSTLAACYLRSRYYDPATGRFLTRDQWPGAIQLPQSLHAYAYAHLDPVNITDPSGNESLAELSAATQVQQTIIQYYYLPMATRIFSVLIPKLVGALVPPWAQDIIKDPSLISGDIYGIALSFGGALGKSGVSFGISGAASAELVQSYKGGWACYGALTAGFVLSSVTSGSGTGFSGGGAAYGGTLWNCPDSGSYAGHTVAVSLTIPVKADWVEQMEANLTLHKGFKPGYVTYEDGKALAALLGQDFSKYMSYSLRQDFAYTIGVGQDDVTCISVTKPSLSKSWPPSGTTPASISVGYQWSWQLYPGAANNVPFQ